MEKSVRNAKSIWTGEGKTWKGDLEEYSVDFLALILLSSQKSRILLPQNLHLHQTPPTTHQMRISFQTEIVRNVKISNISIGNSRKLIS